MQRLGRLALVVLAVFALATVAASLDTVSTEPTLQPGSPDGVQSSSGSQAGSGGSGETADDSEGERKTPTDSTETPAPAAENQLPLWQALGGLSLFVLASVAALYGLTRGAEQEQQEQTAGESGPNSPGPAPDSVRLGSDVPPSNEVYRAWNALCEAVPIDPEGRTPAAVERAAVEAGHPPELVTELAETFCRIRYGECEPTGDRQQRAREIAAALSLSTTREGQP